MSRYNTLPVDTKIALAFFDLGRSFEKRCQNDLALENYRKALSFDPALHTIKDCIHSLLT